MRKFIFLSIVEKLQQEIPEIKHFDLWNNQLAYIEGEQPFDLPAVFVEFRPIRWQHQGNSVREAAVEVVLHVLTKRIEPTSQELPYNKESLQFFDLLTDINSALRQHSKTSYNFGHDSLTSIQSDTDNNSGEIRHDIEVFSCHTVDASAMPNYQKTTATIKVNT